MKHDEVKGGFPPTSGIKKCFIKRKQEGRPGARSRPEYSSGDRYQITFVKASLITQLKPARICADHPTPMMRANFIPKPKLQFVFCVQPAYRQSVMVHVSVRVACKGQVSVFIIFVNVDKTVQQKLY